MAMWRPAERIRHDSSGRSWPTAAEATDSLLFSPLAHGALKLRERTWVPAMVPWRATSEGAVTTDVLEWYERFAIGRPGALVVEATGIRDVPSGPLLRIGDDRYCEGLGELVRRVRRASDGETQLYIQLIDFLAIRRRPSPERYFSAFLTVRPEHREALEMTTASEDAVRARLTGLPREALTRLLNARELEALDYGARERVTDTDMPHIRDLPQQLPGLFAAAAVRARQVGFDGVELHFAHAYTLASFLSPLNTRTDGYGGNRAGRVKLPLEVYSAVRRSVGEDFVVGCRFLSDECISQGGTVEDAEFYAGEFAQAGMDFISLSRGGKFDDARQPKVGEAAYPYTGKSGYECMPSYYSDAFGPFGRNLKSSARIRRKLRSERFATPVVVSGGFHNFAQCEAALSAGDADVIAFARQALADPDWFMKVRLGHGAEVRLCIYSNYCEALDQQHRQVSCELWDRQQLDEEGVALSSDGKRRLVAPAWRRPSSMLPQT